MKKSLIKKQMIAILINAIYQLDIKGTFVKRFADYSGIKITVIIEEKC